MFISRITCTMYHRAASVLVLFDPRLNRPLLPLVLSLPRLRLSGSLFSRDLPFAEVVQDLFLSLLPLSAQRATTAIVRLLA